MVLILEVIAPQAPGGSAKHEFLTEGGTIGRAPGNTWVLPHSKVSGRHAVITSTDGVFYIEDTSRNGIILNSRRLTRGEPHPLRTGDRLLLEPYEISVWVVDDDGLPPRARDDRGRDLLEGSGGGDPPRAGAEPGESSSDLPTAFETSEPSPSEKLDPLLVLDLQEAARKTQSRARDLDAGSPPDSHFRPPVHVPEPSSAPLPDPTAIPEDYDPFAPDEPATPPIGPQSPAPVIVEGTPAPLEPELRMRQPPIRKPAPVASAPAARQVEFSAYFPALLPPSSWRSCVIYAHVPSARSQVQTDSLQFFGRESRPDVSRARAEAFMADGAEIQIVPWLPDCEFNPPRSSILWMEEWHRVSFRVRALPSDKHVREGIVRFYVGPVLVGELSLSVLVDDKLEAASEPPMAWQTSAYQAVFVSYCHEDSVIVDQLQRAYSVLGISYLRDIGILRSGEAWNEALLAKIPTADIFQLCWSRAAKSSSFVEQEWRYALELQRRNFIRPVYWETPMPPPPNELSKLHFAQLHWLQQRYGPDGANSGARP